MKTNRHNGATLLQIVVVWLINEISNEWIRQNDKIQWRFYQMK